MTTKIEIAINKAKNENEKSIEKLQSLCAQAEIGELLFHIYFLRIIRIFKNRDNTKANNLSLDMADEIYKYIIPSILKYGKVKLLSLNDIYINLSIDNDLTLALKEIVTHINSNYESISLLTLCDDIELFGERNQYLKLNLEDILSSDDKKIFFDYTYRTHEYINLQKQNITQLENLLIDFEKEYSIHSELLVKLYNLSAKEISNIVRKIMNHIMINLENNENKCPILENNNIDINSPQTLINICSSFIIDNDKMVELIGSQNNSFLNKLIFKSNNFNISELSYPQILREPIIKINNYYIISPELLLDSLHINIHYSLLESEKTKNEYKKNSAIKFVDEIANISNKHGYIEIQRELELYKKKNKLGDIDLILYNKNKKRYLLIEAKNHSLPLAVYHGDLISIKGHLEKLKISWEQKVLNRLEHIKQHHDNYNIGSNFDYIIVSKYPEIISHTSDILILAIKEYEYYLEHSTLHFKKINEKMYHEDKLNLDELKILSKDYTNFTFF